MKKVISCNVREADLLLSKMEVIRRAKSIGIDAFVNGFTKDVKLTIGIHFELMRELARQDKHNIFLACEATIAMMRYLIEKYAR